MISIDLKGQQSKYEHRKAAPGQEAETAAVATNTVRWCFRNEVEETSSNLQQQQTTGVVRKSGKSNKQVSFIFSDLFNVARMCYKNRTKTTRTKTKTKKTGPKKK